MCHPSTSKKFLDFIGQMVPAELLGILQNIEVEVDTNFMSNRSRYPDGNTETVRFPNGWILNTKGYLPPKKFPPATTVIVQEPVRTDIVMFQQYSMGIGGISLLSLPLLLRLTLRVN